MSAKLNLMPGMVIGVTNYISPVAAVIRAKQAGANHTFDFDIPSHILICSEWTGNIAIEMNAGGIARVKISKYTRWPSRIVFTAIHPLIEQSITMQAQAMRVLNELYSLGISYGTDGLIKHLNSKHARRGGLICSDLYLMVLRDLGLMYPDTWMENTSPMGIQNWDEHKVKHGT
jgi:hypothetical protein